MSEERQLRAVPDGQDGRARRPLEIRPDEEVMQLLAGGDERALAELYDRYGRVAYGVAVRIVRDRALAEDAVQDAFLTVWRTAAGYDAARTKPSTWLLTLVHRRAVDLVRREERRRADPLDDVERIEPGGPETAEVAAVRDRRRIVQAALATLPDDQRQALELAYYGGLSQSEVADRLGVPLGTIKSRMFVGLKRLRDELRATGFDEDIA